MHNISRSGHSVSQKKKTTQHLCEQAQKAIYGLIRKICQSNLPVESQLDLFDTVDAPVLL